MSQEQQPQSGRAPMPPIAVIGIGSLFPKAQNVEEFWSLIKSGADAITEIPATHWRPEDYFSDDKKKPDFTYAKRGGFLEPYPFDPLKYGVPPTQLEATDTSQLLGLVAAEQAMADAGYATKAYNRDKASVILGVTGALELVIGKGVVPGAARQRGRGAHLEIPEHRRYELRGRCRVREFARRDGVGRAGARDGQGGPRDHRRRGHLQRHFHVHVLQQDARALPHR